MKRNKKRLITALIIIVAVAAVLVFMKFFNGNLLYISTGMGKSVVMKVDGQKTYTFEAEVLMSDAKKQYEDMFGSSIWTEDIAGQPFEEYIKEQIRVKLIRVRCMNSMAKERGVVLGREEKNETAKAAEQYFDGLTEEQKSQYDITEDKVNQMFTEFAIASKLYNDVTSLMDIEVSSDDARVINIQYIVTDSKEEIDKAYAELNEGNSFFAIAKKYNADGEYEYELRRGEMAKAFEDTAYSLSTGQTSGIVEADGRFYIIRCTSDNDKAKTEVNKSSILEKKKLEAFNDKFEQYVEKAIKVGLDEISFTEHFPLPKGFTDPAPNNDSSIKLEQLKSYINDVNKLKDRYKDKIKINVGAEVDYVEGFEKEIKQETPGHIKNVIRNFFYRIV